MYRNATVVDFEEEATFLRMKAKPDFNKTNLVFLPLMAFFVFAIC